MKIRYYQKIDGWRWLGFILAMVSAFTLSGGNPDVVFTKPTNVHRIYLFPCCDSVPDVWCFQS